MLRYQTLFYVHGLNLYKEFLYLTASLLEGPVWLFMFVQVLRLKVQGLKSNKGGTYVQSWISGVYKMKLSLGSLTFHLRFSHTFSQVIQILKPFVFCKRLIDHSL